MAARIPRIILGLNLLLLVGYGVLLIVTGWNAYYAFNAFAFGLFPITGAVILSRQPRNRVGWVVTVAGMGINTASMLSTYAGYAIYTSPTPLPLGGLAAWVSLWLWCLAYPCVMLILLLFPDGKLPSRRWRFLPILALLASLPLAWGNVFLGWPNRNILTMPDESLSVATPTMQLLDQIYNAWGLAMLVCIFLALASFIQRFLRSSGIERMQLKWFVFALSSIPISIAANEVAVRIHYSLLTWLSAVLDAVSIVIFPVVMLIAVTRYRLYDIDFIIRRTLLYSLLSLTLGVVYFSAVLLMQALFTRGFGELPSVLIVLSTLLTAALFQPLRRRFQAIIDRQFNRRKYDAEQTLEQFSARLRNEMNLEEIQNRVIAVIDENIQPERAELWLLRK